MLEVPECRSNPLNREPKRSTLHPATMPIPGKVKKSLTMSTVFEELMDIDQSSTKATLTTSGHCAGYSSEKFKEDDIVPRPSLADSYTDQCGLVISPHIQGSLKTSPTYPWRSVIFPFFQRCSQTIPINPRGYGRTPI